MQGAFILTISTAFVKLAGFLFTIPIANLLGGEGMGYFYSAYDIYNMLAVLASAGLPVAVSRMISETLVSGNTDEAEEIYKISVRIFTVIGAVIAAFMFFGADLLADLIKNPNAGLSIRALSVTAFCAFVMSALRGYFQGHSVMAHTAVSQVIEAFAKLFLGCALAFVLIKTEYEYIGGSAGAILGVSIWCCNCRDISDCSQKEIHKSLRSVRNDSQTYKSYRQRAFQDRHSRLSRCIGYEPC
ncbi:MAG: hypothetical protein E7672_05790 [Ruminococcaceae bacterium]|nr:hypothetical protein [Oscillospiraceae bacterium]